MAPTLVLDNNATVGLLEVGVMVSMALLGIIAIQAYTYFSMFPNDPLWMKFFVAFVVLFEFAQAICMSNTLYVLTVSYYGDSQRVLQESPVSLAYIILFNGFTAPMVQVYYANRIFKLTEKPYIPGICVFLSVVRFSASLVAFAKAVTMRPLLSEYITHWRWILALVLSACTTSDVLITCSMVHHLFSHRKNALHGTARIIDGLIAWTIETGLMTSVAAILIVVFAFALEDTFAWLAIFVIISRLFTNSLLTSLNRRTSLRKDSYAMDNSLRFYVHGVSSTTAYSTGPSESVSAPVDISVNITRVTDSSIDSVNDHPPKVPIVVP